MKAFNLKQTLAAAALALPLSAFAGHDFLLQEMARTDSDPFGANAHIAATAPAGSVVSPETARFIKEELALTDGNSNQPYEPSMADALAASREGMTETALAGQRHLLEQLALTDGTLASAYRAPLPQRHAQANSNSGA